MKPPRFPVFGLASLGVLLAGSVLISDESKPSLATILSVVGAVGLAAWAWINKRQH